MIRRAEMEITIGTFVFTERDMYINTSHDYNLINLEVTLP
jgi:hypothetical protein